MEMQDTTKYRDFGDVTVEIEDSGIVKKTFKAGADVGVDVLIPVDEWLVEHFGDQALYVLYIVEYGASIDQEAREYGPSKNRIGRSAADAVVLKTLAQKIILNFYLKYNKPKHPTRSFASEQKAREWLLEMMDQGNATNV